MATVIVADPPAVRVVVPLHGRHAFTLADIATLIGGLPKVIRLRALQDQTVFEVLIVRNGGGHQRPVNPLATAMLREAAEPGDDPRAIVRGNAWHGIQVAADASGTREEFV